MQMRKEGSYANEALREGIHWVGREREAMQMRHSGRVYAGWRGRGKLCK